mmetsp:Transcript_34503/g.76649  ORF Transcript_34503/g.76649 Transcript_34503/m.76649 type:complete len:231 (+) Transcript_34503:633-1325(+)
MAAPLCGAAQLAQCSAKTAAPAAPTTHNPSTFSYGLRRRSWWRRCWPGPTQRRSTPLRSPSPSSQKRGRTPHPHNVQHPMLLVMRRKHGRAVPCHPKGRARERARPGRHHGRCLPGLPLAYPLRLSMHGWRSTRRTTCGTHKACLRTFPLCQMWRPRQQASHLWARSLLWQRHLYERQQRCLRCPQQCGRGRLAGEALAQAAPARTLLTGSGTTCGKRGRTRSWWKGRRT